MGEICPAIILNIFQCTGNMGPVLQSLRAEVGIGGEGCPASEGAECGTCEGGYESGWIQEHIRLDEDMRRSMAGVVEAVERSSRKPGIVISSIAGAV